MSVLDSIRGRAASNPQRIVFAEEDPLIYQAADELRDNKLAIPVMASNLPSAVDQLLSGKADGLVAGVSIKTDEVVRTLFRYLPLSEQRVVSSSLLVFPSGVARVYADCALLQPDNESTYALIERMACLTAHQAGLAPVVAHIGYYTDSKFVQYDAAVDPRVAARKGSPVLGNANVMIYRNLEVANTAYKIAQYEGQAHHIGPILHGFPHPCSDLSRGASIDEIVNTACFVAIQAQQRKEE